MALARMTIANDREEMRRVNRALTEFLTEEGIPTKVVNRVRLVVEELVVNVIDHAYDDEDAHMIMVGLRTEPHRVAITIEDDGKPFDPRNAPSPPLSGKLEERTTSGHGIYIVKHMTNLLDYARAGDRNRVRAVIEYGPS
jgi:anti-sigma regulatory factor (Ser/Thr protein kinase)